MNETYSSFSDEVRALADAQFEGRIERDQVERLESLILGDHSCLHVYVERMVFHGELLKDADQRSPAQAAVEIEQIVRRRLWRHKLWRYWIPTATALSLLLVIIGVPFAARMLRPAQLGIVANLSTDGRFAGAALELGQVVHTGETYVIEEGVVSLQLPNALVDLIGPVTVTLKGPGELALDSGRLMATILEAGEQFKVTTPDVEVLDLGTEFLVHYELGVGTNVIVRQGRVQARLLDWQKATKKVLELTDRRAAFFQESTGAAKEIDYEPQVFSPVDRCRGGILSTDGTVQTPLTEYSSLLSGAVLTFNHLQVIPEQQNVLLQQDLTVMTIDGPVRIPAGSTVSSYLVHYDPPGDISLAPRGSVTFLHPISAVITQSADLLATDALLGLERVQYESGEFRGLELGPDEDSTQVSKDRRTVSFRFDTSPPQYLDEARILTVTSTP